MRSALWLALLFLAAGLIPAVQGHAERESFFPPGDKQVPVYRESGPYFVTCKDDTPDRLANQSYADRMRNLLLYTECMDQGFEHLQAAVDAVPATGWRIFMQPGVYNEEPSVAALQDPAPECADFVDRSILEYDEHLLCPNIQNTVAILGDRDLDGVCGTSPEEVLCDLQIEGTGLEPLDVLLDTNWVHLNGLRADRADGIYLRNFAAQRTDFNAVYILETDGFVIDTHLTRWNYEYGYLTFAVDHGLYTDCESYGNGDSGIYPGSASDLRGARHSVEIRYCDSHHNALGYSGTAGNSVWVHHNKFHNNSAGISTDSLFPDHPGLPQDSGRFENNWVYSNNINYFDNWLEGGPCHKPLPERGIENGTVCPVIPLPVGTGMLIAGGNANVIKDNWFWDNWRYGTMLFGVPALFRGEDGGADVLCASGRVPNGNDPSDCFSDFDPADFTADAQIMFDTSHDNKYIGNRMGLDPAGEEGLNGIDHWWDESGQGNCWQNNIYARGSPRQSAGMEYVASFPECGENDIVQTWRPPHPRLLTIVPCNDYSVPNNTHPDGCEWMNDPEAP